MATALTAFPADGYTARWQRWDDDGGETLHLRWENEGWTATGEVAGANVSYVLRLSATWSIRQFLLFRDLDDPDLWLGNDGTGRWGEMNGAHRTDLDGCHDIDLTVTPFTNTIPIRRLQLDVGHAAEIATAMVDVDTLGVVAVRQRYHHVTPRRFAYSNLDSGFATEFDVDEYGLVHDYPGYFRRV
ncbi:MAG: putative glycolipid-binding domain-containing protein [Ilumatobacter sp.]|nr:putative glycolipid-binding domain-containing protein [Ilumatobacter sp.]